MHVPDVKNKLENLDSVDNVDARPRGKRNNGPTRFMINGEIDKQKVKEFIDTTVNYVELSPENREYDLVFDVYEPFGTLKRHSGDIIDLVIEYDDYYVGEIISSDKVKKGKLVKVKKDELDENNFEKIDIS